MDSMFKKELKEVGEVGEFIVAVSNFFADIVVGFGEATYETVPMHDITAVMALLFPTLFEIVRVYVDVETKGEFSRGQLIADFGNHYKEKVPQTELVLKCKDIKKVKEEIIKSIKSLTY